MLKRFWISWKYFIPSSKHLNPKSALYSLLAWRNSATFHCFLSSTIWPTSRWIVTMRRCSAIPRASSRHISLTASIQLVNSWIRHAKNFFLKSKRGMTDTDLRKNPKPFTIRYRWLNSSWTVASSTTTGFQRERPHFWWNWPKKRTSILKRPWASPLWGWRSTHLKSIKSIH